MLRSMAVPFATLGLLLASFAAAPAVLAGDPCFHSFENRPPSSTGGTTTVSIADCTFGPTVNHVPVGTEVVWRNLSSQPHEVVGANLEWGAHDKLIAPGDSMGWTFETPGIYGYSCMLHPGMTGVVVVGEGPFDAAAAGSPETEAASSPASSAAGGLTTATAAAVGFGGAVVAGALLLARSRRPTVH